MVNVAVMVALGAALVISLWSLFDKRVPQWLPPASLGVGFVGMFFAWDSTAGWERWAMLAVGIANLATAAYRFVRPAQERRLP